MFLSKFSQHLTVSRPHSKAKVTVTVKNIHVLTLQLCVILSMFAHRTKSFSLRYEENAAINENIIVLSHRNNRPTHWEEKTKW